MASVFGAAIASAVARKLGEVVAGSFARKSKAAPAGAAQAVTEAVVEAVSQSEDIAIVKTKPMMKSVEGWTAIGGAAVVLLDKLGPLLGYSIDQPISEAVETITAFLGLPVGTGKVIVAVGTVGAFAFIWVRRKWFTHTITPAAADRAFDQGKVV